MDRLKSHDRNHRHERGMAYLETLIALPVVLLLVFGMADLSFAFQDFLAANHSAEVAARSASLSLGNNCDDGQIETRGQQAAAQAMARAGVIQDNPASIASYATTVTVTHTEGLSLCTAGILEISLPMELDLKMIRDLLGGTPSVGTPGAFDPKTVTIQAVAQNENDN